MITLEMHTRHSLLQVMSGCGEEVLAQFLLQHGRSHHILVISYQASLQSTASYALLEVPLGFGLDWVSLHAKVRHSLW